MQKSLKNFTDLAEREKIRCLRKVVLKALELYEIRTKIVRFLTIETNTYFRIDTTDKRKYAMRIYSNEETTLNDNLAEVYWLIAIKRDTDLLVPKPVPMRNGDYIALVDIPDIPGEHRCVVFEWIPGKLLGDNITARENYILGQFQAKLHNHAASLILLLRFSPKNGIKYFITLMSR